MAGENIKVALQPIGKERASPAEAAVEVTLTNAGAEPATLDLSHAHIPSLALEIRDAEGRTVLLPPPPVPKAEDVRGAQVALAPGESHRIVLALPFDVYQPGGRYQVRFRDGGPSARSAAAATGGALASDWVSIVLEGAAPARTLGDTRTQVSRFEQPPSWGSSIGLIRWLYWLLRCIRCLIFRKRCNKVVSAEVDRTLSETISNAPPPNQAWNGTYGWHSRFQLSLDQPNCRVTVTVRLRLAGTITPAQRTAWETAIETKWSNTFKLCCTEDCCTTCCAAGYTIICDVQFVATGEHHVVNVGPATTNMTNWSAVDTIDITHEFGHMLGNKEEYFTVDGTDFGAPRQPGGNVMNNPANGAVARHFDLIRTEAQALIGAGTTCTVKGVREAC